MACKALRACSGRRGRAVGALADLSVFSLYPVKAMTNGEGGVITTERFEAAYQMRSFRNHGITLGSFRARTTGFLAR
jgi:dTDP-4-amino-4,6-dideoxygalactose transaminase